MSASLSSLHLTPPDARRAGLIVVGAAHGQVDELCAGFAEQGYEVMAPARDELDAAVQRLTGPIVMLSLGEGAAPTLAAARRSPKIVAISLFDPPVEALATAPACAMIAHFSMESGLVSAAGLDALRDRARDLSVYPYPAEAGFIFGDSDAARLARLRTLQLFHRAGGKAEMGG